MQRASGADDAELVGAARQGDLASFGLLLDRHQDLLRGVCRRALYNSELAEDAAQEACLQALLNLDRLRDPVRFGPWLAGIGLNVCRQMLRERARDSWSWEALCGGRRVEAAFWETPEEHAETAEVVERVRAAVHALPTGQREAVLLHYLEGFTQRELAALLGIRAGAVKVRLHRARANLRQTLLTLWKEEMEVPEIADTVEMRVIDVRRAVLDDEAHERFVLVLEEVGGERRLPIWIGPSEGRAIAMSLEKEPLPRPGVYEFTSRILEAAGGRLSEIRINRLAEATFYAEAIVAGRARSSAIDTRPSDAIALALLEAAPIRVDTGVLDALEQSPTGSWRSFEDELRGYGEGAAEIAAATKQNWEAALREVREQ
jgi:RNA polymerase sigma factor (sigma-70 family)